MSAPTRELTKEEIEHLVASDANLIGLTIAAKYAMGATGICLARDIRDVIYAIRHPTPSNQEEQP